MIFGLDLSESCRDELAEAVGGDGRGGDCDDCAAGELAREL